MGADSENAGGKREQRQVRDAYGLALLLILISTLAIVATGIRLTSPLAAVAGLLQIGALVLTLQVSGFRSRWSRAGSVTVVALFLVTTVALSARGDAAEVPTLVVWLSLTITAITAIVRRLVTYKHVTLQMLMGLLVVYLLIGIAFGIGYMLTDAFVPHALTPDGQGMSGAIYFSFITLATVGFGDVVPGNDVVRALSIAEALIGQLYLVSVVSLAVSRFGARRQTTRAEEDE